MADVFISYSKSEGTFLKFVLPWYSGFVAVVMATCVTLVLFASRMDFIFPRYAQHIERSLLIGSGAMLIWVAMDHGNHQALAVLFGPREGSGIRLSSIVFPCLVVVAFYCSRRLSRISRLAAQLGAVAAAVLAFHWVDTIGDFAASTFGIGMPLSGILVCAATALAGVIVISIDEARQVGA